MYVSENDAGTKHEVHLRPSRQAYLVSIWQEICPLCMVWQNRLQ